MRGDPLILGYHKGVGERWLDGISQESRAHHLYALGASGSGKSTLLFNLFLQDVRAGRGAALIDPHGDLAQKLLDFIPPERTNDVIYFCPSDREFPVGLNVLYDVAPEARALTTSSVVSTFKNLWADSWGVRLEYILANTVAALLEVNHATLLHVVKFLRSYAYRQHLLKQVRDPVVKHFFTDEFDRYTERFRTEAVAPILNKVGQFVLSPLLRNIVGQTKSRVDFRRVIDSRQLFIANLSKGETGTEPARLLGSFLVTQFQLAAMSRSDVPERERTRFHLYVDEFSSFNTTSVETLLSEARKYGLCLHLFNQQLSQLSPSLIAALFGNVGTLVSFRVSPQDSHTIAEAMAHYVSPETLVTLPRYQAYVKPKRTNDDDTPYLAEMLPGEMQGCGSHKRVLAHSRMKFARPRGEVEAKIARWLEG